MQAAIIVFMFSIDIWRMEAIQDARFGQVCVEMGRESDTRLTARRWAVLRRRKFTECPSFDIFSRRAVP